MTPNEIRGKQFERKRGAYRIEEVGSYLIEVAEYVDSLLEEKRDLEAKLTVLAEKLEEYRADEESLRAALIGAQKLGDSVVREAKDKAEQLLVEASQRAEQLVSDAKSSLDREALELTRMQSQVANFRDQVADMYRRQLESIMSITAEYNFPEPQVADVPLPAQPVPFEQPEPRQPEPAELAEEQGPAFDAASFVVEGPLPPASPQPEAVVESDADVTFKRAEKVDTFVLSYDELGDLPEDAQQVAVPDAGEMGAASPESPLQHRKRSNFGDLRFGEEYNLTRKE